MVSKAEAPVKILVVDDDEVYREILQGAVEGEGLDISLVSNGAEALERLQRDAFDILISDLNMPGMDGLTLLRRGREMRPHLLAIIVTGYGSLESAIEAIRLRAYDYIQKPFKIEEMVVTARNAVEKVRILREKAQLLLEIEKLRHKLQVMSALRSLRDGQNGWDPAQEERTYGIFPSQVLPLCFLEMPGETAYSVLSALESLKDLKREGVINEFEMRQLKKQIVGRADSGKP